MFVLCSYAHIVQLLFVVSCEQYSILLLSHFITSGALESQPWPSSIILYNHVNQRRQHHRTNNSHTLNLSFTHLPATSLYSTTLLLYYSTRVLHQHLGCVRFRTGPAGTGPVACLCGLLDGGDWRCCRSVNNKLRGICRSLQGFIGVYRGLQI